MGIVNIHYLFEDDASRRAQIQMLALQEALIEAHRRGEHPYGLKRRDCPLCQAGK